MRKRRVYTLIALSIFVSPWLSVTGRSQAEPRSLPPGVVIETVATGLKFPVTMAFAPDGRLFYLEKGGAVRVINFDSEFQNPQVDPIPWLTISVTGGGEQGLLGLAFDPDFETNGYVYLYYTEAGPNRDNVVARFTEVNGRGDPDSRVELWRTYNPASNHNGGNLRFGPDGMLYITVGDGGGPASNGQARANDLSDPLGKIHRVRSTDGSAPPDNPFYDDGDPGTGNDDRIWALGLRNSFDFDFHPVSGEIWASENGPGCNDELNLILPGANYGWIPGWSCDGQPSGTVPPLFTWTSPIAVTGVAVYTGERIPAWRGSLFVASWNTRELWRFPILEPGLDSIGAPEIVVNASDIPNGARLDVITGPDGNLYFSTQGQYNNNSLTGAIYRFVQTGCVLPGDLDGDNRVTVIDLMLASRNWNVVWPDTAYQLAHDRDLDGDVDLNDLMLLAEDWPESCP